MPSKEELLASIKPDMVLTKQFIKRIYGYGVTDASFPDRAIAALEAAGCSKARQYYESWMNEHKAARDAELKETAHWYRLECEKEREGKKEVKELWTKIQEQNQSRQKRWMELSEMLGFPSMKRVQ